MTAVERHLLPATHGGEWEPDLWQGRPDWHTRAACRGVGGEVSFFPQPGDWQTRQLALSYCARCPVIDECRDFAASQPALLVGIWGGDAGRARRIRRRHVPNVLDKQPELIDRISELRAAGLSWRAVAATLDVPFGTLEKARARHGITDVPVLISPRRPVPAAVNRRADR